MTDTNGAVVWRASYTPFGVATVDEDPDGDGVPATLNLRFPGQYYDDETGLHYNYFRYYDPRTGRYITSDPIGLHGGLNTYTYVENNPANAIDPSGLATYSIGFGGSFQQISAGASASGSIGFDSIGQVCMQFTTCGRIGPGQSAGATVNFSVGEGNFCEGNSASGGLFAEGGGGLFGGGSADYGTGGASATGGFNIGIGAGAAVGSQTCITKTWCF